MSSEHKKKHEHKKVTSLPPGVLPDGGLKSRIHGVPGSTPGCTAGAYAKTLDADGLPEVSVKSCFPDQYAAAKKWISEAHPKSLQLLLTAFGPEPTIADIVNKWLIRRVGRKCPEGTEEGRKDMEAFCVDAIKRLRKLPVCTMKLFRAVPWSAMGKCAPGLSEFEEETNIVWPTFSSLTKSEACAREMLKEEGGILFVVNSDQARDVTDVASVHQFEGEFMLEPNSVFTISSNKQEEKIFVVEMKQIPTTVRPILKESEDHKHHHHHESSRSNSADPSESTFSVPQSPVSLKGERSATIVTPVMRRVPSLSSTPLSRKNSLPMLGDSGNSMSSPGSPRFPRTSSRLAIPMSPHGPTKVLSKPAHRVRVNKCSTSMTVWSAAQAYIKVYSTKSRGKNYTVKAYTPDWASPEKREKKKEEEQKKEEEKKEEVNEEKKEEEKKEEEKKDKEGKEKEEEKEGKKGKKKKDKKKKKEKDSKPVVETHIDIPAGKDSEGGTPPVSPTSPGYGTMELYPKAAPTYIIDDRTVDWQTIGGIILNSTRGAPLMYMSLRP